MQKVKLDHKFNKPVLQLDLDGNIINRFKSKTETEKILGVGSLYYNLKEGKPLKGYIFKYE